MDTTQFAGYNSLRGKMSVAEQLKRTVAMGLYLKNQSDLPLLYFTTDWGAEAEARKMLGVFEDVGLGDYRIVGIEMSTNAYPDDVPRERAEYRSASRFYDPSDSGRQEEPIAFASDEHYGVAFLFDDWVESGTTFAGAERAVLRRWARGRLPIETLITSTLNDTIGATHMPVYRGELREDGSTYEHNLAFLEGECPTMVQELRESPYGGRIFSVIAKDNFYPTDESPRIVSRARPENAIIPGAASITSPRKRLFTFPSTLRWPWSRKSSFATERVKRDRR